MWTERQIELQRLWKAGEIGRYMMDVEWKAELARKYPGFGVRTPTQGVTKPRDETSDSVTKLPGVTKPLGGRPKKHGSAAARQRAYREGKKKASKDFAAE